MKILDPTQPQTVSYCVPAWLRDEQIKVNIKTVKGRIEPFYEPRNEPIAIVCFGPSLNDTWEKIKDFKYVMSCSGAHKFLIERGITPTWHIEVDPREHKVKLMGDPHKDVEYLIASTCHPKLLEHLKEFNVKLWHVFDPKDEVILPKGEWMLTGGCSVGVRCITLARFMGFKEQHIFGMDGCSGYTGKHAAAHPNQARESMECPYDGVTYSTTPAFLEAARNTFHELNMLKDVEPKFYGEGLVQHMARNWKPERPDKEILFAFSDQQLISPELIDLNRKLHTDHLEYGVGGSKYADIAKDLMKRAQGRSLLDYGCQPLSAKVLTAFGWKEMGEIKIGDEVIGSSGMPTKVLNLHRPGQKPVFKVNFNDDTSLIVDEAHHWSVRSSNHQQRHQPFTVKTTAELLSKPLTWNNQNWIGSDPRKWRIPMVSPIHFRTSPLPINPYLLGVLLGDGCLCGSNVFFTSIPGKLPSCVECVLPPEVQLRCDPKRDNQACNYRIIRRDRTVATKNPIKEAIKILGLNGLRAWEKFVPNQYLLASPTERQDLLQGLLDTDGEITNKRISYCTTSKRLSMDVRFIAQSLGCTVKTEVVECPKYQSGIGRTAYNLSIKVPQFFKPVRAKNFEQRQKYHANRVIVSIEPMGECEVAGITVDAEDNLYVTEEFIVTHNCGKGYLGKALDFPIWEYDPAVPGKDNLPRPADVVICADVLEHVEPDKIDSVIKHISKCTLKTAFFAIYSGPAKKTYSDGRNTHLIQEKQWWWLNKLSHFFDVAKDGIIQLNPILHVLCTPKGKQITHAPSLPDIHTPVKIGSNGSNGNTLVVPEKFDKRSHKLVLEEWVKKNNWTTGVEIGVFHGLTFFHLLENCPNLHLTGIDVFEPILHKDKQFAEGGRSYKGDKLPEEYIRINREAKQRFPERSKVIKAESAGYAKNIPDHSLDFVFIDGDHLYESVKLDIISWLPKVRPGGVICGHDIGMPGVKRAVDEMIQGWTEHKQQVWAKVVPTEKTTKILTCIPFSPDKNLGRAYNKVMESLPEDGWGCLLDGDVMFTTGKWHGQLLDAIEREPEGTFVAVTNRVGPNGKRNGWQRAKINPDEHDMKVHRQFGETLAENKDLLDVTFESKMCAGMMILISKKTWAKIGGFADGLRGVDYQMHLSLATSKLKLFCIQGLYVYHWKQGDGKSQVKGTPCADPRRLQNLARQIGRKIVLTPEELV